MIIKFTSIDYITFHLFNNLHTFVVVVVAFSVLKHLLRLFNRQISALGCLSVDLLEEE